MTTDHAPIPDGKIAEIDELLAELTDPVVREPFRKKLLAKAQREADYDRDYQRAFDDAVADRKADPGADAKLTATAAALNRRTAKRLSAALKRAATTKRKRIDRYEEKREAASKSAKPSLRRLPQRDREFVTIIGEMEKAGHLGDDALVLRILSEKLKGYRLPHWDKTSMHLKVMAMSILTADRGAQTINLHLNADVTEAAYASPRGPASYMQDRIRRHLETEFGKGNAPDFWFVLEAEGGGQFHCHGAVVTPDVHDGQRRVDDALRKAGGKWGSAGGHHHQQLSVAVKDPVTWASYSLKQTNVTKLDIDRRLVAYTRSLGAAARANWDELRALLPQIQRNEKARGSWGTTPRASGMWL